MKPSIELFLLIKSLTKSEKRYFKLYSSLQAGDKNYLKLFDAIEKQSEYNEEAIKQKFKKEIFIRHLPSEKNHLYSLILKSLRTYHSENSVGSLLKELLKDMENLYNKALYKECNKVVNRVKKLAYDSEKFYYIIEIIGWEKQLADEEVLFGKLENNLEKLNNEEQQIIDKIRNLGEYQVLYSKINYVFRKGGYSRNEKERAIVEEVANHPLITGKNTALSVRAATMCYFIKGLCAITNGNLEEAHTNFRKVVDKMEQNALIAKDLQRRYVKSLNYLLLYYIEYRKYDEFHKLITQMRALPLQAEFSSIDIKMKIFTATYNSELLVYARMGDFKKGIDIVEDVLTGMQTFQGRIYKDEEILFYYNIAYLYFGAEDYHKALYWINKVLNDPDKSGIRQDIFSFARIFNLIIHYELGNTDFLKYITNSAHRYHVKRQRDYKFEMMVFMYFKKLANTVPTKQIVLFGELKNELQRLLKDDNEKIALQYFDFISWIGAKTEQKPFSEFVKKRIELGLAENV